MSAFEGLEKSLNEVFVKKAPALPEGGKKFIVTVIPWVCLIVGLLSLWSILTLWHWAHLTNGYADQLNQLYGTNVAVHNLDAWVWLGMAVLAIEAVLYLLAFSPTRKLQKHGWDLLFYALLVNLVYGFVSIFASYGGFASFIGYAIGTAIGLWLLFQVRAKYLGKKAGAEV